LSPGCPRTLDPAALGSECWDYRHASCPSSGPEVPEHRMPLSLFPKLDLSSFYLFILVSILVVVREGFMKYFFKAEAKKWRIIIKKKSVKPRSLGLDGKRDGIKSEIKSTI
jgi:hypothetical protein